MSRRGGKKRSKTNIDRTNGNPMLWQTSQINTRLYQYYVDIMLKMAMSRFQWIGLPPTCDARYLEYVLITQGMSSIAFPKNMQGKFLSLQCAPHGHLNMYDRPIKWEAIGHNGTRYSCDKDNGVVVFDNETRYPLMSGIELYANELVHIRMTKRMNRLHQQIPFILSGPQEKQQDMINLFKQIYGGEPAVLTTDGFEQLNYNALTTGVKFIGEELAIDEANTWGRIYTMLGIENSTLKQERQTEDEIRAQENPANLIVSSSIDERRKAADELNKRFGDLLDEPIKVVTRQDYESENWNIIHSLKSMSELGE